MAAALSSIFCNCTFIMSLLYMMFAYLFIFRKLRRWYCCSNFIYSFLWRRFDFLFALILHLFALDEFWFLIFFSLKLWAFLNTWCIGYFPEHKSSVTKPLTLGKHINLYVFFFVFAGTWVCFFKSSMTGLMFVMMAWMYKQANIAIPTDRLSLAKTMGPVS